jgi:hypothetical protein
MTPGGDFGAAPWLACIVLIVFIAVAIFLRQRLGSASKIAKVHFIDPRRRIVEVVGVDRRYVIFLGPNNDFLIETRQVELPSQG